MAAFLTSESADDLVQQMTTLDMIAPHTNSVVAEVAAAQASAAAGAGRRRPGGSTAQAGLDQLEAQQAEVQKKVADYEADFARLTAAEQAAVTAALAGPALGRRRRLPAARPGRGCRRRGRRPRWRRWATPTCGAPRARTASTARG